MLNLKRGFRRLLLVFSVVWVVVSGFNLWRLDSPASPGLRKWKITDADTGESLVVRRATAPTQEEAARIVASRFLLPNRRFRTPDGVVHSFPSDATDAEIAKTTGFSFTSLTPLAIETLAQTIRRKYPGTYDDLNDRELEAKVRTKYPGMYDSIPNTPNLSTDPNAGIPIAKAAPGQEAAEYFDLDAALAREKAVAEKEKRNRLRSWLEAWLGMGFVPPVMAFALLEGLLWTARGFSEKQPRSNAQDKEATSGEAPRAS